MILCRSGSSRVEPWSPRKARLAFTLMEIMLALATSAIVLAGIGGVFYSAMRLRQSTVAVIEEASTLHHAFAAIRRDLLGALPPTGNLAGDFKSGAAAGMGFTTGASLQFSTTTGHINESVPWGDVQEVVYELRSSTGARRNAGGELVRLVTRNLLSTTQLEMDEQLLLEGVESFEVSCYDGYQWLETWDTSLGETNLPSAVRIRLLMTAPEGQDSRDREPVELIVPLVCQSTTNAVATATEEAAQ